MKNISIVTAILVLIVLGGAYLVYTTSNQNQANMDVKVADVIEEDVVVDTPSQEATLGQEFISLNQYKISEESSVFYTVIKNVIAKKEPELVTGANEKVSGDGWFDSEKKIGYLKAVLDFKDFSTDSSIRDQTFLTSLDDTSIIVELNMGQSMDQLEMDKPFELDLPLFLTINKVTKEVVFKISGEFKEDGLSANGTASILATDFNIKPPSLAGIHSVDNEIEIGFDITGMVDNQGDVIENADDSVEAEVNESIEIIDEMAPVIE